MSIGGDQKIKYDLEKMQLLLNLSFRKSVGMVLTYNSLFCYALLLKGRCNQRLCDPAVASS